MKRFFLGVLTGIVITIMVAGVSGYVLLRPTMPSGKAERLFAAVAPAESHPRLAEQTAIFEKRIEEVSPGVHVAIGYGLANVVVIEAPEGLILIDALESIDAAEGLLPEISDIRNLTGKEITDVIYSHYHPDHVFGSGVLLREQTVSPRIWAHEHTADNVHEMVNVLRPITFARGMRQFGVYLPEESFENAGIGPSLHFSHNAGIHYLEPNETIGERFEGTIAGEPVIIQHAPGETTDQLFIFLKDRNILLPADNYYHSFPNLYAIRGTPYRDIQEWASSIDLMIAMNAEIMVPQHTQPVIGKEVIREHLTNYRDAIQYVHDQTIRMINRGMTPDEIAETIELPPHLKNLPYLQEFYGRVDWSARAVFAGTLGWFSGDPQDLLPVSKKREAELMVRLAGNTDRLREEFTKTMEQGEPAWALILATHLDRLGESDAGTLRAAALVALGEREISATGRNYFLTSAAEAVGFKIPPSTSLHTPVEVFDEFPLGNFLRSLQVSLKAEDVLNLETAFGYRFTDTGEEFTMRIRRGVAIVSEGLSDDRAGTLITTSRTFKEIAMNRLKPAAALATGRIEVDGGVTALTRFLGYFDPR
ncbi:MAG: alkyl sulfatase dimerization domain-containing protein [Planctomycetaceae bacterium]